ITVLLAYALQAIMAFALAQRFYPVTYETGRLVRVCVAGIAAAAIAVWLPSMPALAGLPLRGRTTGVVDLLVLPPAGFVRPTERAFVREIVGRAKRRRATAAGPSAIDVR